MDIVSYLVVFGSAFIVFGVQLLLCFKVKNKIIRAVPAIICIALTAIFFVLTFIFDGWDALGYLLLALLFAALAVTGGCAFLIWQVIKLIKRKKK